MSEPKKAVIAMSGGVDSSVAAYLMCKQGYECVGMTMKLFHNEEVGIEATKTCCSASDADDARRVARLFDMPFYVVNFTEEFQKEVIDRFVDTYIAGGTPNPCIECNRYLKFQKLMDRMHQLSFDYVVTGHYARVVYDEKRGRYLLKKGLDESKDQSYVLYNLTQDQLSHTLFPLGEYNKTQIREIAKREGFVNAKKPDSQDICFVPDGNYARFIETYCGKTFPEGDFVNKEGEVLGRHKGMIRYTIGQRRGLGLSLPESLYVCEKRMEDNTVVLCRDEELYQRELVAEDLNWIAFDDLKEPLKCKAKIRYKQKEADATVEKLAGDKVKVTFDLPQRGMTPGQAVVFYDGDEVLGGGKIF
ncbi:MAG: tRNA 2-thiouridine(34) synthase MnmA [Lachnospiraceae bacterium]|nr:tRNA 2-thiouridine(34) synthase MnmA [Lachnospiraceae bacterium]